MKYDILTKYIRLFSSIERYGDWKTSTPVCENAFPFIHYNSYVKNFIKDMKYFLDLNYYENLQSYNINEDDIISDKVDISKVDDRFILTLITFVIRQDRFNNEGILLYCLKKGIILKWLKRIKDLDEY